MKIKADIAIVTPVHNGGTKIQKCIDSILAQSFANWIHVIINDGSTDLTEDILSQYGSDPRHHIINLQENIGRGGVRKLALEIIKKHGIPYMCMLDADDVYYPEKLKWQFEFMQKNLDISLLSCSLGYINSQNNLIGVLEPFNFEKKIKFTKYIDYIPVPHASSIIRVKDVEDISFDENLKLGQDQDFMIRFLINKYYMFVPKIVYLYNREDSFSYQKYRQTLRFVNLSYQKLHLNELTMLKIKVINKVKLIYVGLLCFFNLKHIYFKNILRFPTDKEVQFHDKIRNVL